MYFWTSGSLAWGFGVDAFSMVYKHPVFADKCKLVRGGNPCDLHTFELGEGCGTHYSSTSPYRDPASWFLTSQHHNHITLSPSDVYCRFAYAAVVKFSCVTALPSRNSWRIRPRHCVAPHSGTLSGPLLFDCSTWLCPYVCHGRQHLGTPGASSQRMSPQKGL